MANNLFAAAKFLVAASLALAAANAAMAQIVDISGVVKDSNSSVIPVGSTFDWHLVFSSPLVDLSNESDASFFSAQLASFTFNGVTYISPQPESLFIFHTQGPSAFYGLNGGDSSGDFGPLFSDFEIQLTSPNSTVLGANYFFAPGVRASDFAVSAGSLADNLAGNHTAHFVITDVVIAPNPTSPVPEPATYGLLGAAALLGSIAFRRRKA